jgi:hypothetical protein
LAQYSCHGVTKRKKERRIIKILKKEGTDGAEEVLVIAAGFRFDHFEKRPLGDLGVLSNDITDLLWRSAAKNVNELTVIRSLEKKEKEKNKDK